MLKVLFVDDEPFIMQGLSMIIDWRAHGFEIIGMSGNAKEAIGIIEKELPDLVIADVRMPEMSGLELLEIVRRNHKEVNFIMLSGYSEFEYARKALTEGCIDYLLKPVNEQELLSALERLKSIREESTGNTNWNSEMPIAPLLQFFRKYNPTDNIDELKQGEWNSGESSLDKKHLDELIHAVETNRREEIMEKADEIHHSLTQADNLIVNMELNYILYELLHLATNVDESIDRQEVLQFISDSVLEWEEKGHAEKGREENSLSKVLMDYSEYLCELRGNQSPGVMSEIESYLKNHFSENITLKDLGKMFFVNSAYLGQIFKKQFGVSFKDYLNELRIQKAEELLIYSDKKIYEIAAEIGYKDIDYFINKFISIKGVTPAKYRKQMK